MVVDFAQAAGKKVFFSLCGWESWYAPPDPTAKSEKLPTGYDGGPSLGNSYRIRKKSAGIFAKRELCLLTYLAC